VCGDENSVKLDVMSSLDMENEVLGESNSQYVGQVHLWPT
jgi:hypothetical protein